VPPSELAALLPADTRADVASGGLRVLHAVTVEWGDCDPAGIIFYPTYFRWWDQGTWRLFWAAGIDRQTMREQMGGAEMPIINAAGTFETAVTPGDRLTIETTVERWGNSSFRVAHRATMADGKAVAHGHETRCWVASDPAAPGRLKAMHVPDHVIARLGGTRA
jgi:acyl-CoA thioesterase FadM